MNKFDYKAVLFDMDGVVLDSMEQHSEAWLRVMGAAGLRVKREFVLAHEGCLHTEVLEKLLQEQGVVLQPGQGAAQFMLRLLDEQRRLYLKEFAHLVSPYPGASGLLKALGRRGVPTALVTSSGRAQVQNCLPGDLLESFAEIVSSDDVIRHKPHPEPYLRAARALDVSAHDCLVVENAPRALPRPGPPGRFALRLPPPCLQNT